jgi:hypothetical protein
MIHNLTAAKTLADRLGCGIAIIRDNNTAQAFINQWIPAGTIYDTRHDTSVFPPPEDAWGPR